MRLRQIAFAASDLAATEPVLLDVLGLKTGFRDPGVGEFGLHNAVIPVGGNFLEIVAPLPGRQDTAAGRYIARRGGDTGYMAIFHAADAAPARAEAARRGIRAIWLSDHADVTATHFHPVDMGGVIVSVDSFPTAPDPMAEYAFWKWAGPDWRAQVDLSLTRRMTGAGFRHPDPAHMAETWSALLGLPATPTPDGAYQMQTGDGGRLRFRPGPADAEPCLAELDFAMTDRRTALRRAAAQGLPTDDNGFDLMQVRFNLTATEETAA